MHKHYQAQGVPYLDAIGDSARIRYLQRHYAICTVWVPSEEYVEQEFKRARQELGLRSTFEFHASQLTKKERTDMLPLRLFELLKAHAFVFEAWCLEIDKTKTNLPLDIAGKELTYALVARALAPMPQQRVAGLPLIIDDSTNTKKASTVERELRTRIKELFETDHLGYRIGPIRLRPANQKAGLQLADFMAAAFVRPWSECHSTLSHWSITHWRV